MLFNSLEYFVFLPFVFLLYYIIPGRFRWIFLLLASYYFYMCWRAEYIVLILLATAVDYSAGRLIEKWRENKKLKKIVLCSAFSLNLSLLFFFKYYDFFTTSMSVAMQAFNIRMLFPDFDILLPVGISFYTFQSLSYTIDVYRGTSAAEKHLGYYALYVSFFPQMVAGPIERPAHLLPQLKKEHSFDYALAVSGIKSIAFGFFKKSVIADRLAFYVSAVFDHPDAYHGLPVALAFFFFTVQIYCDFSGYSDIAIGSARLLGIKLIDNFKFPYFSSSFREFWQRWHISLSGWFRDYVYIPLGGSRVSKYKRWVNIFITFLISGIWHGANWTFVIWGAMHGLLLIAEEILGAVFAGGKNFFRKFSLLNIVFVFVLLCFTMIFVRAASVNDVFLLLKNLLVIDGNQLSLFLIRGELEIMLCFVFIILLFAADYLQYKYGSAQVVMQRFSFSARQAFYIACVFLILAFGIFGKNQFIYFQF
ncbi:MAG: MBOAT family O-acyltransferase [Flavobacteriales bacterium]